MPAKIPDAIAIATMLSNNLLPIAPYPGSTRPWPCVHRDCGKVVQPNYNSIANEGSNGCKNCGYLHRKQPKTRAPRPQQRGFKGDQGKIREWAIREKGFLPMEPCPGVSHKWKGWCMSCWQETTTRVDSMRAKPGPCPCFTCGHRRGGDRLRTSPDLVMARLREHGVNPDPDHVFTRVIEPWPSTCAAGHPWNARPVDVFDGHGCPACVGLARITADVAEAAARERGFEPAEPFTGTARSPWRIRCKCGYEWRSTYSRVTFHKSGCPACVKRGFAPTRPAYVYVVVHLKYQSVKIGLRGAHSQRIAEHRRQGWELHEELLFAVGADAQVVERLTHDHVRKTLQLPIHLTKEQLPQRGYEETTRRSLLHEGDAWELVQRIAAVHTQSIPLRVVVPTHQDGSVAGEQMLFEF
ncbi:hypothetical protein [Streptomyces sp. NPDC056401]|uniref:hypothetical protein n=1 Tax=Streptomyces sp. NPDC056401 TaxID=3345809 RepID=UPI0035D7E947